MNCFLCRSPLNHSPFDHRDASAFPVCPVRMKNEIEHGHGRRFEIEAVGRKPLLDALDRIVETDQGNPPGDRNAVAPAISQRRMSGRIIGHDPRGDLADRCCFVKHRFHGDVQFSIEKHRYGRVLHKRVGFVAETRWSPVAPFGHIGE